MSDHYKDAEAYAMLADGRQALLLDFPEFTPFLLMVSFVEDGSKARGTAATDGVNLYYDPVFVKECYQQDHRYIPTLIAHELAGHCAFRHLDPEILQGRDRRLANVAQDYEINWRLQRAGFVIPEWGLISKKYADQTWQEIYDLLEKKKSRTGEPICYSCDAYNHLGASGSEASDKLRESWRAALASAAAIAAASGRGYLAGSNEEVLRLLRPSVPWQQILAEFVVRCVGSGDYTFAKPSRRGLSLGLCLPSIAGQKVRRLVFCMDTSGSMSNDVISRAVSAAWEAMLSVGIESATWIECDTQVQRTVELNGPDDIPKSAKGRGGTSFVPAIKAAEKLDPVCIVYFTDLAGEFPASSCVPVIWVTETNRAKAPFGRTVLVST